MAELRIEGLTRRFGALDVLRGIDLQVRDGEFMSLLGPSGCGKSTTLSLIAGLERPSGGSIWIGGCVVAGPGHRFVPPEARGLGLVPQSYALWPHMTVRGNVGFPLEIRGGRRADRDRRVDECLALVEIGGLAERYPHELSGGQQQRVALARALAYQPTILLLDEPFSNVDAKLRERARSWLRRLQRRIGLTTVFVTHDQAEALTMSDRIAVMSEGAIVQVGTPVEVYTRPSTAFVADFIGSSNLLSGTATRLADGSLMVEIGTGRAVAVRDGSDFRSGDAVLVAVRMEQVVAAMPEVAPHAGPDAVPGMNWVPFVLEQSDYVGGRWLHHGRVGAQAFRVESAEATMPPAAGLAFAPEACIVFEAGS